MSDEPERWPGAFSATRYRVTAELSAGAQTVDRIGAGFVVWSAETLNKGRPFEFKDNYFQVAGRSVFLEGTDDYLHTFVNQEENPLTWHADAQACRDACIDVYENLRCADNCGSSRRRSRRKARSCTVSACLRRTAAESQCWSIAAPALRPTASSFPPRQET